MATVTGNLDIAPGGITAIENAAQEGFLRLMASALFAPEEFILNGHWRDVNPPASAAEIHNKVVELSDDLLQKAEQVVEYKHMYPANAFLTKRQVRDICLRYNLVFAPEFLFAGEIPEKNKAEISAFKLHPKHADFVLDFREIVSIIASASGTFPPSGCEVQARVEMPARHDTPFLLPFGERLAIWSPNGFKAILDYFLECRHYHMSLPGIADYKVVLRTDQGFVFIDPRWLQPANIEHRMDWEFQRRPENFLEFRARMSIRCSGRYGRHEMARQVICPASMLHPDLAIHADEAWEIEFGDRAMRTSPGFDPIILQPVDEGYLVVTKWDAEALIPEVAGQTN